MVGEVLAQLSPKPGGLSVDGTLGGGGHAASLLEASSPDGRLVGIDLDPGSLALAETRLERFHGRFTLLRGNFADLPVLLSDFGPVDGVLLDLGVGSHQLDDPARGLSFSKDGPLDMRLDPEGGPTAEEIVNRFPEAELIRILQEGGEARFARRIARRICRVRGTKPLKGTAALADIVTGAVPRRGRIHPATRTFQALRIAVNRELENLAEALMGLPEVLAPGGRAVVISFHSGEDRLVKHAFKDGARRGLWEILTAKPRTPDPAEREANPRSRSAKLRAVVRR
jgi:16S rRNA (cytosine1402-N4)-methyltransferase